MYRYSLIFSLMAAALCAPQIHASVPKQPRAALNEKGKAPYVIQYQGRKYSARPEVLSPKFIPDAFFFADRIAIKPGESFLEIGSGTGLISVVAAHRGAAKVVAVDSDPVAVMNTTDNVMRHQLAKKFHIYQGNVFDPVAKSEQFDTIFWYSPFTQDDQDDDPFAQNYVPSEPSYSALDKYLSQARQYLKPGGKLLLGFNPAHGNMEILQDLAGRYGWRIEILASEKEDIPWAPEEEDVDSIDVMLVRLHPAQPRNTTQATTSEIAPFKHKRHAIY